MVKVFYSNWSARDDTGAQGFMFNQKGCVQTFRSGTDIRRNMRQKSFFCFETKINMFCSTFQVPIILEFFFYSVLMLGKRGPEFSD